MFQRDDIYPVCGYEGHLRGNVLRVAYNFELESH